MSLALFGYSRNSELGSGGNLTENVDVEVLLDPDVEVIAYYDVEIVEDPVDVEIVEEPIDIEVDG